MALAVARAVSDATETAFDDEDAPAPRCESCGRCVPSFPSARVLLVERRDADPGRGSDADVSDAEDDSARADDDFDRHVLARTPRARDFVETASTPGARDASRPGTSPSGLNARRTNEPRARRRSGGRRRGFRRLRADSPLFSRRGPTRGVPSRRRRLARRLSRLGFLSPSRLPRLPGRGAATRVNPSPDGASFGEPNAKTTSSFLDDSASRAWDGPLHKVLASFSPRGTATVSPGEKASARGNGSISTRARWRIRDGTRHAIRTRSPRKSGAFSTPCDDGDETRRRRRDGMTETRWDDGDEMRRRRDDS